MSERLVVGEDGLARCRWGAGSEEYRRYHDQEWGRPVHGDRALFERFTLEAFQSGLSWLTILRKREGFRAAFDGFDPVAVSTYDDRDVERLLGDTAIVRNRAKIAATITNAGALVRLQDEHGDGALDALVWSHRPVAHVRPGASGELASTTPESVALAKALKRAGFVFVGPTTAYAAMQAVGVVDDHVEGCHAAS